MSPFVRRSRRSHGAAAKAARHSEFTRELSCWGIALAAWDRTGRDRAAVVASSQRPVWCSGTPEKQPALDTVSALTRRWNDQSNVEQFQSAQYALWTEQRKQGSPWLVTDFITVGSPLAHAHMLMARNADELRDIQRLRELPRCPPQIDGRSIAFPDGVECNHQGRFRVLHHAAMFGCVRWTNVWFQCRFGVTGDWLAALFGERSAGGFASLKSMRDTERRKLPLPPPIPTNTSRTSRRPSMEG